MRRVKKKTQVAQPVGKWVHGAEEQGGEAGKVVPNEVAMELEVQVGEAEPAEVAVEQDGAGTRRRVCIRTYAKALLQARWVSLRR